MFNINKKTEDLAPVNDVLDKMTAEQREEFYAQVQKALIRGLIIKVSIAVGIATISSIALALINKSENEDSNGTDDSNFSDSDSMEI